MISAPHCSAMEGAMQSYINHENVRRYRKLIAISDGDPCRDEAHGTKRCCGSSPKKRPRSRSQMELRSACRAP
jgi:hypothetical protein